MLPLFLMLAMLTTGTTASSFFNPWRPASESLVTYINGTGVFNPATEKCCLGGISPGSRYSKCCGNHSYDTTSQLCCKNEVRPLKIGHACCGNDTYDTVKEFCCYDLYNVPKPASVNGNTQCCGNVTYDSTKNRCCGSKLMDAKTEICCVDYGPGNKDVVYKKKYKNSDCCGTNLIDLDTQNCCMGKVYDRRNETCCFSTSFPKLIPISKARDECCGRSMKTYDPKTEMCCGDEVHALKNNTLACCDNQPYNPNEEDCCYESGPYVIKKTNVKYPRCCGSRTYDPRIEDCCRDFKAGNSSVYSKKAETCCNGKLYKLTEGFCCTARDSQQNFFKIGSGFAGCCGSKGFSIDKQVCCEENVYDRSDTVKGCCGDKPFDPDTQTCCTRMTLETLKTTGTVIDEKQPGKYCCGSKLISQAEGRACCGDQDYDPKKQICCGKQVFDIEGQKNACCFPYMNDQLNFPLQVLFPFG